MNLLIRVFFPFLTNLVEYSKVMETYSQQLAELDEMVRRMVLESLGVEKYLEEHLESTNYLLRVMKYKGTESNYETKIGLHSHTDKNIVTILYQNHVQGLQVKTKDGKWINFQPSPDSFVAMIGDSFHVSNLILLHFCFLIYIHFIKKKWYTSEKTLYYLLLFFCFRSLVGDF